MCYVLSNLGFEYSWARQGRGGLPPKVVFEVARRWGSILRLVAAQAKVLPVEAARDGFMEVEAGRELLVWGWTPLVVREARKHGLVIEAPPVEVVGEVNSKVFSHGIEQEYGWTLPGACVVDRMSELESRTCAFDGPWLLKHPWGVSGREQRRGRGALPGGIRRWAQGLFQGGEKLVLEPLLEVVEEYSLHFEVERGGRIRPVGECVMEAGSDGTLRGVGVAPEKVVCKEIARGARRAAEAVAEQGYFGPVGIDAMVGMWKGKRIYRPVTEINARMTFGRLALILWSRLKGSGPEYEMVWVHPSRRERERPVLEPWTGRRESGNFLLPEEVDPGGRSGTYLLVE